MVKRLHHATLPERTRKLGRPFMCIWQAIRSAGDGEGVQAWGSVSQAEAYPTLWEGRFSYAYPLYPAQDVGDYEAAQNSDPMASSSYIGGLLLGYGNVVRDYQYDYGTDRAASGIGYAAGNNGSYSYHPWSDSYGSPVGGGASMPSELGAGGFAWGGDAGCGSFGE